MTPGEAVSRKQRGILDDTGHADVSVEESERDWDFDFDDCSMIGDWWHEPEATPIHDQLVMDRLAAAAPRPSLWTRTPDWVIGVATLVLLVLLALPLVLS